MPRPQLAANIALGIVTWIFVVQGIPNAFATVSAGSSACPNGIRAALRDLLRDSPSAENQVLPSIGEFLVVEEKIRGRAGHIFVTRQGEVPIANSRVKDPTSFTFHTGLAELALQRPRWAKARGISVTPGRLSEIKSVEVAYSGGFRFNEQYVAHVEVRYGDAVEANFYLSQSGRKFRYFAAREKASPQELLDGLAKGTPEVPYAQSGSTHFHDISLHVYEVIPDSFWPNIRNQARFLKSISEDPQVVRLFSRIEFTPLREEFEKLISEAVTEALELASSQRSTDLGFKAPFKFAPHLQYLAETPQETALRAAERLREYSQGQSTELSGTLIAIADRVETLARGNHEPSLVLKKGQRISDFEAQWRAEIETKLGPYVPLTEAIAH